VQWLLPEIPATQKSETRKIVVQGQPKQKLFRPHLRNKSGMLVHAYNSSYTGGLDRRISVCGQPVQKHKTLSEK
jgi:hypothetical protein